MTTAPDQPADGPKSTEAGIWSKCEKFCGHHSCDEGRTCMRERGPFRSAPPKSAEAAADAFDARIADFDFLNADDTLQLIKELRDALRQQEQGAVEGWKLVPVDGDYKMTLAAGSALPNSNISLGTLTFGDLAKAISAAIAAATQPPAVKP